jgi:hypothetical protein
MNILRKFEGLVVVLQQLLNNFDLVLEALLLVCPGADPDVTLDSHNAVVVQQSMALPNDSHAVVP